MDRREEMKKLALECAAQAIEAGADGAEVIVQGGSELSVKVRLGRPELLHEAASKGLGLRLFRDGRAAVTYTSDFTPQALRSFIADSVALCALSEPDELNRLPEREDLASGPLPDLGLWDDAALETTAAQAMEQARRCEEAARATSDKITKSDGASYSRVMGTAAYACADRGGIAFAGATRGTYQSLSVEPICDDADGKKRNGSYFTADRFVDKLLSPEEVGREAARRALRKLGPEKIETQELPVVFDPDAGRGILRLIAQVISGGAIYRKSSYLVGREGTQVASPLISVIDDPLIPGAPGSRAFDGDGLAARRNVVIQEGVLMTYLLDTYSARKLGRRSNGCAGRSVGGSPHVTTSNFILQPGGLTRQAVLSGISRGLYVTEMMGFGFNAVTGDFSRGAAGFLIEDGEIGRPVSEITISCNFDDLLKRIDAVADDIDPPGRRTSTMCPTFRVSRMMIAGR